MQAPIVKPDNLQYIVDGIYKELTELKIRINESKSQTIIPPSFTVVKQANDSYQIQFTHPDGKVVVTGTIGG